MKKEHLFLIVILSSVLFIRFKLSKKQNKREQIVHWAEQQLGKTYLYGGKNPKTGFDCSGLVYYIFTQQKIQVPRSSYQYKNFGIKKTKAQAQIGDIILFTGYIDKDRIGHIGIITQVTKDDIIFIHSSSGKKHYGVVQTSLNSSYYNERFVGIRDVID